MIKLLETDLHLYRKREAMAKINETRAAKKERKNAEAESRNAAYQAKPVAERLNNKKIGAKETAKLKKQQLNGL